MNQTLSITRLFLVSLILMNLICFNSKDVLNELRKILKGKDLAAFEQLVVERFSAPENPKTEADYRNMTRE